MPITYTTSQTQGGQLASLSNVEQDKYPKTFFSIDTTHAMKNSSKLASGIGLRNSAQPNAGKTSVPLDLTLLDY